MTRTEIIDRLKSILTKAIPEKNDLIDSIDETNDLRTQLGLNSIGMICMVIMIENEFSIQFDDIGFSDFKIVADVVDYIAKKRRE